MATVYYTASSIDGFIADSQHSLSWLLSRDVDPTGPLGFGPFEAGVGGAAMGSSTYRWLLENDRDDGGKPRWGMTIPCWVFSHQTLPLVEGDVRMVQGPVEVVHAEMVEAAGGRDVWVVGGGDLAGQFAAAGLLDEVWVQYAPVALGSGAPLLPRYVEMQLLDVQRNRDFACARYAVMSVQPSVGNR